MSKFEKESKYTHEDIVSAIGKRQADLIKKMNKVELISTLVGATLSNCIAEDTIKELEGKIKFIKIISKENNSKHKNQIEAMQSNINQATAMIKASTINW